MAATMLTLSDIRIRDPFLVTDADAGRYVLFGTTDPEPWSGPGVGFDAYVSDDLVTWTGPIEAFRPPAGFIGTTQFWAPEVWRHDGRWFMFATFGDAVGGRGTHVLVADEVTGPYRPWSDGAVTPAEWLSLDGTLHVDDGGQPWLVFCHEWLQVDDGEIVAQRLSADLRAAVGEPTLLFRASESGWATGSERDGRRVYVTDGPFLVHAEDGALLMLWSSHTDTGYAIGIARSATGGLLGPWTHDEELLFDSDGGHGMIATLLDGTQVLALHRPNGSPHERAVFTPIVEREGTLRLAVDSESSPHERAASDPVVEREGTLRLAADSESSPHERAVFTPIVEREGTLRLAVDSETVASPQANWAGTYAYTARDIVAPTNRDELASLIRSSDRVHALGTRHSFNSIPDTAGTLIDLTALPDEVRVNAAEGTATVTAWTRYGVVALALEAEGFALHNMGSLPHISVGGATATATHGSGDANGNLSTAVRAITFLDANGESRTVRRGDAQFGALVVGVGAFGIVTDLELDVQPSYRVRQDVYAGLTWDAVLADLDTVTSAGHSVSIFTQWEGEDIGFVWVKTRLQSDDDTVPETLLDGALAADASPLGSDDNVTELHGVPGPWLLRLPHFRLDREPSFGAEIQTEYFVDRSNAVAALAAVRELAADIRPHLVWTELRTIAADDLWLSTANGRDSVAIHFTWHDRPTEVAALVERIETVLAPFDARPHWGKVHSLRAADIAPLYPRFAEARAVFEQLDPDGRFVNEHLQRIGLR